MFLSRTSINLLFKKTLIQKNKTILFATLTLCFNPNSYARFNQSDADEIDRDELITRGFYNDEISYRPPISWSRTWRKSDIGILAGAGSYNAKRFFYYEDLKLTSSEKNPASVGFKSYRRQDLVEERIDREVRITMNSLRPFYFSIMGDGDSKKEYGDLGAATALKFSKDRKIEIYYWSVDHFYNTKKMYKDDRYEQKTYSYGILSEWSFNEKIYFGYNLNIDTPLEWKRLSRDYLYKYERTTSEFILGGGNRNEGWNYFLKGEIDLKKESKKWYADSISDREKTLKRKFSFYELVTEYGSSDHNAALGLLRIERNSDYTFENSGGRPQDVTDEVESPDMYRDEYGMYGTYYMPAFESKSNFFQYGLYFNQLKIDKENQETKEKTEVKFQFAWDYKFDEHASMLLISSWDIDQLESDFPYDKRFRPWDGGAFQINAVF